MVIVLRSSFKIHNFQHNDKGIIKNMLILGKFLNLGSLFIHSFIILVSRLANGYQMFFESHPLTTL